MPGVEALVRLPLRSWNLRDQSVLDVLFTQEIVPLPGQGEEGFREAPEGGSRGGVVVRHRDDHRGQGAGPGLVDVRREGRVVGDCLRVA